MQVVPEQSATFGADASQRIALDTDHRGMNKFGDRNSNYSLVAGKLLNILIENSYAPSEGKSSSSSYVNRLYINNSLSQF